MQQNAEKTVSKRERIYISEEILYDIKEDFFK